MIDTADWIAGAWTIGDPGLGPRGDSIPLVGEHGGSVLANDIALPGEAADEFMVQVDAGPVGAGTVATNEDGTFTMLGWPDGVYTFDYKAWKNGVPILNSGGGTSTTVTVVIGTPAGGGTLSGNATASDGTAAGGGIVSLPSSSLTGNATAEDGTAAGGIVSTGPAVISGNATAQDGVAGGAIVGVGASTLNFDAMQPFILPSAPGCPWPTAVFHLRQAAIDFFQRTLCWRNRLPISSVATFDNYLMGLPDGSALAKLLKAWVCKSEVKVFGPEDGVAALHGCFVPGVWTEDRVSFYITPTPEIDGTAIELWVALKPSQTAEGIPDFLYDQYADPLAQGALSRLLAMKGKAWSDPAGAATARGIYERYVGDVQALASRGFSRAKARTRPQPF